MNAQPSWFSRNWKWLAGLGCVVPLLCCGSLMVLGAVTGEQPIDDVFKVTTPVSARVDCGEPGPGGVDCIVKRTEGEGALTACWKLAITCRNQGVMRGDACGALAKGQAQTTVNMPVAGFSNQDGCDVPAAGAVQDLGVVEN